MTWTRLTGAAAVWAAVLMLAVGIVLSDVEALAIGVGVVIGVVLLRWRSGLLGRLLLLVLFADIAAWMVPAAVTNVADGEDLVAVAAPLALSAVAVMGLMADVVTLVTRNRAKAGAGRLVLLGLLVVVAGVAAAQAELFGEPVEARQGELVVKMKDARFEPDRIEIDAGTVSIVVDNADLFWHTFTVDELDVDVRVPVKAARRVTFRAEPGSYELVCAIPGHEDIGMDGTLVVASQP